MHKKSQLTKHPTDEFMTALEANASPCSLTKITTTNNETTEELTLPLRRNVAFFVSQPGRRTVLGNNVERRLLVNEIGTDTHPEGGLAIQLEAIATNRKPWKIDETLEISHRGSRVGTLDYAPTRKRNALLLHDGTARMSANQEELQITNERLEEGQKASDLIPLVETETSVKPDIPRLRQIVLENYDGSETQRLAEDFPITIPFGKRKIEITHHNGKLEVFLPSQTSAELGVVNFEESTDRIVASSDHITSATIENGYLVIDLPEQRLIIINQAKDLPSEDL